MKILALNPNGKMVDIQSFFSKYPEFLENTDLIDQTVRFLKVILRNVDYFEYLTEKYNEDRSINVNGLHKVYTIVLNYDYDCLILKDLLAN